MNPSQAITTLTLICFLIGFAVTLYGSIIFTGIAAVIVIILSAAMPKFNHLQKSELFKCLITMFIFGIIDAYYYINLWINEGEESYLNTFGVFVWLSTIRYYSEFQLVNLYHHHQLAWQSFLIYHSKFYFLTNIFLLIEHSLVAYIFQFQWSKQTIITYPALVATILAMLLRILAFYTAKSNFTHKVSFKKKESHELVTNGIYSVFRHPSYTGFFYYTIASMLLIGNWVSAFLFAMMLSYFFDDRIEYEEHYLLRFFGDKYENYRNQTYVLIPVLPQWVKDKLPNFNG